MIDELVEKLTGRANVYYDKYKKEINLVKRGRYFGRYEGIIEGMQIAIDIDTHNTLLRYLDKER